MSVCEHCGNLFELPCFSGGGNHYVFVDYFCKVCQSYLDSIEVGGSVVEEGYGWSLKDDTNERKNSHKARRSF